MPNLAISNSFHYVNWPLENVLAFSTTRHHPSIANKPFQSCYDSFNVGLHVNDNAEQVLANRQCLQPFLPQNIKVQWFDQVHGSEVIVIDEHLISAPKADAAITTNPDIALAIMTADCLPILLTNRLGNKVAAIHGGWRPLSQQIIANTLAVMAESGQDIVAWLGPCIGPQAFEVGEEVKQAFDTDCQVAFKPTEQQKYLADLQAIAHIQLTQLGVRHIYRLAHCTYSLAEQYYSYRRDQLTGRMASIICRR